MRKLLAVASIAVLFAVACAKAEDTTVPTGPSPTVATSQAPATSPKVNDHGTKTFTTQNVSFELEQDNDGTDFYFNPTFIKLPGASTVKVTLKNAGSVEHTFTSPALKVDEELQPGKFKEVTIAVGSASRYDFYCKYHKDSGMRGAFMPH